MNFDSALYKQELKQMVDVAINLILKNNPRFEFYTVSIWTDANAAYSAIAFDTKEHSDKLCEGNSNLKRNYNPADYEFSDFVGFEHESFGLNWEEESKGRCWNLLEPVLKLIGEYTLERLKSENRHTDFELSINGPLDWYEHVWK